MNDIILFAIMAPVSAFIVLAGVLAIVISLERTLGRSIPKLHDGPPVERNRGYSAVIVCMLVSFLLVMYAMSPSEKVGMWTHAHLQQDLVALLQCSILVLVLSGAIGWVVFAMISTASATRRIIRQYLSNSRPI
jgi:hypothetical protein